ncbi:MAG TPA: P22 phage major capsid protein family protein [Bryobacteraceae bacterium]|nr:P22 phage major capsid protein family protein [Bryobacteraceae bacterium]
MGNVFLTPSMITLEALSSLKNQLQFTKKVNRQYDDKFGKEGAKIGNTLNVRMPPRYVGRRTSALAVEDITQTSTPLVLNTQYGCDINFTSADLLLSIERFSQDIIQPAVASIANAIDYDGLALSAQIANYVGTPGVDLTGASSPTITQAVLSAKVALDNSSAPRDGKRYLVLDPQLEANAVDALKGLFQSSNHIKEQYEMGEMGTALGFQWSMDQNTQAHTVGNLAGDLLVDDADQTGSQITVKTGTAGTKINPGDILQFEGVYQVNLQNRQTTGVLQPFTVTELCTIGGDGTATVKIAPPLTPPDKDTGDKVAGQTVTASPASGAKVYLFNKGTANYADVTGKVSPTSIAFHRDAFVFATADLPMPRGVDMAARIVDPETNISMRLVRAYDVNADKFPCRLDVLGGWAVLRRELACRIQR